MKNVSIALNAVLLVAVIVLYVLFFKQKPTGPAVSNRPVASTSANQTGGATASIAYFNMDSLEKQYLYIVDTRNQLKGDEQNIDAQLNDLKRKYMARVSELQQKAQGQSMSQQEGEAAQNEINRMQGDLQQKEAQLTQNLQDKQFKVMQDINKKIEDYLKTYNQDKGYAFILSHQPGDFIYYKDSANNITSELVKGLNDGYKKPK